MKKKTLIPPDSKQCQAMERKGGPYSFMTLGPIPPLVRCCKRPSFIAKENKKAADGRKGSMSLCAKHAESMKKEFGVKFATLTAIKS